MHKLSKYSERREWRTNERYGRYRCKGRRNGTTIIAKERMLSTCTEFEKYIVNERTVANKELWYHVLKPQPLFIASSTVECECVLKYSVPNIFFNSTHIPISFFSACYKDFFSTITFHSIAIFITHTSSNWSMANEKRSNRSRFR